jgi:NADH-ubiquinone reductase complex 1 MLRQ subunit
VDGTSPASRGARMVSNYSVTYTSSLTVPNYFSEFPLEFPRHIVVWTKSNPTPWNEVKQDENVKMMAVNQKFDKRYVYVPLLLASLAPHR